MLASAIASNLAGTIIVLVVVLALCWAAVNYLPPPVGWIVALVIILLGVVALL